MIVLFVAAGNLRQLVRLKWMAIAGFLLSAVGYYLTSQRLTPQIGAPRFCLDTPGSSRWVSFSLYEYHHGGLLKPANSRF